MIRLFSVFFTFYYSLLIVGLSFNLHYCNGKLASLSIYDLNTIENCCNPDEEIENEMPCCSNESEIQQFQTEHSVNEAFKISKKAIDVKFLRAFIYTLKFNAYEIIKPVFDFSLQKSPKKFHNPYYITYCSLVFYDTIS